MTAAKWVGVGVVLAFGLVAVAVFVAVAIDAQRYPGSVD